MTISKLKKVLISYVPEILFYGMITTVIISLIILVPYSWPPDEDPRYRLAVFIRENGRLPLGEEPEIMIFGFGGSYAYMPMLPYIIMGYIQRLLSLFLSPGAMVEILEPLVRGVGGQSLVALGPEGALELASKLMFLIVSRGVNGMAGLVMAVFVRKSSKLLFKKPALSWLFSVMVMFLPQLLFLHSYVNVDSFALAAGAIILYGALRGRLDNWSVKSCLIFCVGVIICTLSYYNAYGSIVMGGLLYLTSYIGGKGDDKNDSLKNKALKNSILNSGSWGEDKTDDVKMAGTNGLNISEGGDRENNPGDKSLKKGFFKKTGFIAGIVFLGAGWWFIRNIIIRRGDVLGLASQAAYAARSALPDYNPALRQTIHSQGISLYDMVFGGDYLDIVTNSFIACFESMRLLTYLVLYGWYVRIFKLGALLLLIPDFLFKKVRRRDDLGKGKNSKNGCGALTDDGRVCLCKNQSDVVRYDGGCSCKDQQDIAYDKSSFLCKTKSDVAGYDGGESENPLYRLGFHISMVSGLVIPVVLSLVYSYYYDYQPQGRYIMPMLLPFSYYITLGYQKAGELGDFLLGKLLTRLDLRREKVLPFGTEIIPCIVIILFFTMALAATLKGILLPRYLDGVNLLNEAFIPADSLPFGEILPIP